jgi:hypothetical protein
VLSAREMQAAPDFSLGYRYDAAAKESRHVATRDITNIAPTGAINSSARSETSAGEAAPVKARFSDYRSVEGVLVPFLVAYDVPDTGEATERVKEVKFDAPPPADVFRARKKID